ncbi:MAG: DUF4296 domain-containing protein [Prevotellaceae bacterium]|nr:DUF4296 domain-containing protein [Prevotellaceae bacterium]
MIFALAATACGDKKRIPERKLVRILAEMHLADAVLEVTRTSSHASWRSDSTAVYKAILDRYGYTPDQLYSSIARYNRSKDKATTLYNKVNKRLEKLQGSAKKQVEALHRQQNRWTEKPDWTLPEDGDTARLPFSIPVEGSGEYILEATIALYNADSVTRPRMTMCLYAANGDSALLQVERAVQRNEAGQRYSLSIVNRHSAATHVRGYVFGCDADSLSRTTRRLAATNIMLRFLPSGEEQATERATPLPPPVRVSLIDAPRPLPAYVE